MNVYSHSQYWWLGPSILVELCINYVWLLLLKESDWCMQCSIFCNTISKYRNIMLFELQLHHLHVLIIPSYLKCTTIFLISINFALQIQFFPLFSFEFPLIVNFILFALWYPNFNSHTHQTISNDSFPHINKLLSGLHGDKSTGVHFLL